MGKQMRVSILFGHPLFLVLGIPLAWLISHNSAPGTGFLCKIAYKRYKYQYSGQYSVIIRQSM